MRRKQVLHGVELALLLLLAVALAWAASLERQQQSISDRLIRLHVVAASDSRRDQQIKLAVRDAVLTEANQILAGASSQPEAKRQLRNNLPRLEQAANAVLLAAGEEPDARVSLDRELFGTREYSSFSLPAGYYDSLRVRIGPGAGHNWWCVVYPQICTAATSKELYAVAAMGGLSREDMELLECRQPEYILKFRSLELLESLLSRFRADRISGSG